MLSYFYRVRVAAIGWTQIEHEEFEEWMDWMENNPRGCEEAGLQLAMIVGRIAPIDGALETAK